MKKILCFIVTAMLMAGCLTACGEAKKTAQSIEFVLTDDYVFPDDYPEVGEEVTVIGSFDTYMEGDNRYCTLRNARFA